MILFQIVVPITYHIILMSSLSWDFLTIQKLVRGMNELPEAFLLSALWGLTVLTLSPPCVLAFPHCDSEDPMCSWHSAAVTNTWHSRLLTIRTWFWLRVLEVSVCGQMAMFALRCAVKQRVVSQDPVTKHLTASDWDVRKEKGRSWVPSTLQEHFANF